MSTCPMCAESIAENVSICPFCGSAIAGVPSAQPATYDISQDGKRFLILKPTFDDTQIEEIRLVENWSEEIQRALAPAAGP